MTWNTRPIIAFDLETTGPNPLEARVVSLATIRLDPDGKNGGGADCIVNPGIDIPAEATAVHGISNAKALKEGVPAAEAIPSLARSLIGNRDAAPFLVPVVAFNAVYDITVIHRELLRYESDLAEPFAAAIGPVIDPRVIDKQKDPYRRGSRKLIDVCAHYGVKLKGAHSAYSDALAAGLLAFAMAEKYPELTKVDTEYLHERQIAWYREQTESLKNYFYRLADEALTAEDRDQLTAKAASVNHHWPIIPERDQQ